MSAASGEVVKFYTRPRKIQHLVGKLPDGTRLPGGPYTLTQVVGAAGLLFVGAKTMDVWGVFGGLVDVGLLLAAAVGVLVALGRLRTSSRNPVAALLGVYEVFTAPRFGRIDGRTVLPRRPLLVTHRVVTRTAPLPPGVRVSLPAVSEGESAATVLTGMQQALAAAAQADRGVSA